MKNNRQHRLISTAILMFILVMITALLPVSTQEVQAAKKAKTYKITYKLNGGKNNAKNVKKLKKGKSLTLKNPTRTGYTFKGWYTSKSLKKGKITKIKKIKKNVTVYAKWAKQPTAKKSSGSANDNGNTTVVKPSQPTEYTIVYNLNGGVNNPKNPKTVKKNSSATLYDPTREGYQFVNWYTNSNFTTTNGKYALGDGKGHILYAKWVKITGTEPTEPEQPSEPTGHTHNYNIPVKGMALHNEIFCSNCNTLLAVSTSISDKTLQSGPDEASKYYNCPNCGKNFFTGEASQRNMTHRTQITYAYKCSCGDIQYRTDYDWHKEYQCPTGEHKPVN